MAEMPKIVFNLLIEKRFPEKEDSGDRLARTGARSTGLTGRQPDPVTIVSRHETISIMFHAIPIQGMVR